MHKTIRNLAAAMLLASCAQASASSEIAWGDSFAKAKDAAMADGKLLLVDFWKDNWPWCTKLDKETYTDEKVIQFAERFVPIKIKGDEKPGRDIAEDYEIMGYPTIIIMDGAGEVIEKIVGYRDAKEFASILKRLSGVKPIDKKLIAELTARVKKDKADYEASLKLAGLYAQMGELYDAVDMIDLAEEHGADVIKPKLAAVYSEIGDRLVAREKYAKAKSYYRKALQRASAEEDKCTAGIGLAGAYIGLKRFSHARKQLQEVLDSDVVSESMKTRAQSLFATVAKR